MLTLLMRRPHGARRAQRRRCGAPGPVVPYSRGINWINLGASKQDKRSSQVRPQSQEHLRCLPCRPLRLWSLPPGRGTPPPPEPAAVQRQPAWSSCPFFISRTAAVRGTVAPASHSHRLVAFYGSRIPFEIHADLATRVARPGEKRLRVIKLIAWDARATYD